MKRLLLFTALLYSPLFAEDLPVLWLEAGKELEINLRETNEQRWELRYEHRVLTSGAIGAKTTIKAPPLKPGTHLQAQLLIDGVPVRDAVIASPDPFADRKEWFDKHRIALYDLEKTTGGIFEEQEIPFQRLGSFAEIEAVKDAVIVVGLDVDFGTEKRLAALLFQKAAQGSAVLVADPKGDIPLDYPPTIYSLVLSAEVKYFFSLASGRQGVKKWDLQTKDGQTFLADRVVQSYGAGATILDIRFADPKNTSPYAQPLGRIVFDKHLRFSNVESRWYFKTLIETLTNDTPNRQ